MDDLYKKYASNKNLETEGVKLLLGKNTSFLVRRFGGANADRIQKAMAKYHKPFARQIDTNSLSEAETDRIFFRVFFSACLAGWENVSTREGVALEFTMENAVKLFIELPQLYRTLFTESQNFENYKESFEDTDPVEDRQDLGNS